MVAAVPWSLPATGGWTRRSTALLTALLVQPYLLVLALPGPAGQRLHVAGTMSLLLLQLAVLAAAVVLFYDWRISRRTATGWLALTLSFLAGQHVPFALLAVAGSDEGRFGYVLGVSQLATAPVVLGLLVLAARGARLPAGGPLTVGLAAGGLVAAARLVLIHTGVDPSLRLSATALAAVIGVLTVLVALMAVVVLRSSALPGWFRTRMLAFVGCLLLGRALSSVLDPDSPSPLSVLVTLVGVIVLCGAAAAMLRQTIGDNYRRQVELAQRATTAEVNVKHGREQLHELHATVAGVAQATRLLVREDGPTGDQRRRLQTLLDSELSRLERMLTRQGRRRAADLCVDEVLLSLVETQRTLGLDVRYRPSGLRARARADDLAEVTHILLSNVARHAPGATVEITSCHRDGDVEVSVSDDGPGVPPALRPRLFAWGGRSASSPGEGIGLQLAKRLMLEQGGDLYLEGEGRLGGATFTFTVPTGPPGQP
jgi:signal transduction histidine kinase